MVRALVRASFIYCLEIFVKTFFALSLIALSSSAFANPIDVVIYGNG